MSRRSDFPTTFFVEGIPAPQGSKNAYRRGNRIVLVESSKKVGPWRKAVKETAQRLGLTPYGGPVALRLTFYLPRPKSLPKKVVHMVKKPDLDKLVRSTLDGLAGVAYVDDNQVNQLVTGKEYATPENPPGCHITIVRN